MRTLILLMQIATWISNPPPPILHMGHWQSCGDEERVLEHRINGRLEFELHLGPRDEFALFDHVVDGEDHSHNIPDNFLGTAYHFRSVTTSTGRHWSVPSLKLWIGINEAGGSRMECQAFYVKIERKP